MDNELDNYYKNQLKRLKPDRVYSQSIKIMDGVGNTTNCLSLNSESIPILIAFLIDELKQINKISKETK